MVDAIKEKKRLLEAGEEHEHIRPLLVICGGLMRGVYGGAAVTVLNEKGYTEVFDDVIGISTGSPAAVYFLAGNPRVGNSIYYEECCSGQFLLAAKFRNWVFHPIKTWRDPMDIKYLENVFRSAEGKVLDEDKVFKNRSKLHIAVTKEVDAEAWYINTCLKDKLIPAVMASCDIPGINQTDYVIEEELCVDGSIGEPFPLEFIESMDPKPTHVLVIANTLKNGQSKFSKLFNLFVFNVVFRHRIRARVRTKLLNRYQRFYDLLHKRHEENDCCTAVVWTDDFISTTCVDPVRVKEAARQSEEWWSKLLA